MSGNQVLALAVLLGLVVYLAVEFGWGGGSPNHKDHNGRHD